ncbi:MAG: hypothetical protein MHMPM18_005184 [Marteilia pararefringens]
MFRVSNFPGNISTTGKREFLSRKLRITDSLKNFTMAANLRALVVIVDNLLNVAEIRDENITLMTLLPAIAMEKH